MTRRVAWSKDQVTMATRTALDHIRVADVMHPGIFSCPPDTPLRTVARMMATYKIHCVAVFTDPEDGDIDGRLWGIVSDLDLVGALGSDPDDRTAGGTAASPIVTTGPDETLDRAAQLMREYGTAHLVVVDPQADRPLGVLSTLDVAKALTGDL
jgi:CBS domain-containing protein